MSHKSPVSATLLALEGKLPAQDEWAGWHGRAAKFLNDEVGNVRFGESNFESKGLADRRLWEKPDDRFQVSKFHWLPSSDESEDRAVAYLDTLLCRRLVSKVARHPIGKLRLKF
jgi:hypothetical protein